jgi:hypothetical protein
VGIRQLLTVAVAASVVASCGGWTQLVDRARLDRQDDAYVRIALALGVRDPDSLDFYAGPTAWLDTARAEMKPLQQVRAEADALIRELGAPQSASDAIRSRRAFLSGQLSAIVGRIDVLGGARPTFDEESRRMFGVDIGWKDGDRVGTVHATVEHTLGGRGSIAERYAAFERRYLVPVDRVPLVLARAVDECRAATRRHVDLPPGEQVAMEYVRDARWPAFTKYEGNARSRTQVDLDVAFTVDRLLDLACHETYPGHHTINVLLDPRVQPLYSPQSFRTESAASFASQLAFSFEERLRLERDVLMPLAGIDPAGAEDYLRMTALAGELRWVQADIARRYLDGQLEFARAAAALEDETLMPAAAAEATLKFINEYRTYVVAYTFGYELVRMSIGAERTEAERWRAYERWIGT